MKCCSLLDGVCGRNPLLFIHFRGVFQLLNLRLLLSIELFGQICVLLAICVFALAERMLVLYQVGLRQVTLLVPMGDHEF